MKSQRQSKRKFKIYYSGNARQKLKRFIPDNELSFCKELVRILKCQWVNRCKYVSTQYSQPSQFLSYLLKSKEMPCPSLDVFRSFWTGPSYKNMYRKIRFGIVQNKLDGPK